VIYTLGLIANTYAFEGDTENAETIFEKAIVLSKTMKEEVC
jgi:hypothetical protein